MNPFRVHSVCVVTVFPLKAALLVKREGKRLDHSGLKYVEN
jgi:hypothetical protein